MSNLVPNFLKTRLNNVSGYTKEKEEEEKRMKDINAQIEKKTYLFKKRCSEGG